MSKNPKNHLLLSLILVFAFVYRVIVMLRQTFPPGADIGLHNSIINSITQSGSTNFLWNYYHMGGGSSVTFPGYHIFVSYITLLTGMPDYVAHAVVVSLFSSLVVVAAYLLTRKIWNSQAALIVAFLVAVSRFDLEMLMWGGYPNTIAIMFIIMAFYVLLEKNRFSTAPFLVVAALLSGSIFLTHSLSAVMFIAVTLSTVVFTAVFAGRMGERRSSLIMWILPLILGAVSIAPFLIQVAPAYLGADVSTFTGGVTAIREALLATKVLPLGIVVPLLIFVFLYFVFSKYYTGKFFTIPTVLLVLWWLIPTVLTQGFLFGLYTDYNRFLYYVILPVIVLIGLGFYHSARFIGQGLGWLASKAKDLPQVRISKNKTLLRVLPHLKEKNFILAFTLIFVLYASLSVQLFAAPENGIGLQRFYQLMNEPEYDAIQWAKENTSPDAVFLTDAQYGWWFGGFAERPTLSAVSPEYLTNSREYAPAVNASYILDTDYLIDNGLFQIREDGGYIGRHNPDFLAKRHDYYFPFGVFTFDNNDVTIEFRNSGTSQKADLANVPVTDQHMETGNGYASIYVTRGNKDFTFVTKSTVYQGRGFANITATVTSNRPSVTFDYVEFLVRKGGQTFTGANSSSIAFIDTNSKVAGHLIFPSDQLQPDVKELDSNILELSYTLLGKSTVEMKFCAGAYEYVANPDKNLPQAEQDAYYQEIVINHTLDFQKTVSDSPWLVFDYRKALENWNVSYVALRDLGQMPRFLKDPVFSLVFINNEVAIFKVVQT